MVIAVSAVEHCGLDVYGSTHCVSGDLKAVLEFTRVLKPSGLLMLTLPFGSSYDDDELRIYDSQQLGKLTNGFAILKKQFYRKSGEGSHWLNCSEEECSTAGYDPISGVQGVVLLCARPLE